MFIIGRRPEPLAALAQEIGAQALVGDAASGESWNHALLPAILREAGRIDCLIGSAGGMGFKRITEMTDAQWQGAMDSNLNSAFASARACLPELIKAAATCCSWPRSPHWPPGRRSAATSPPSTR